MDLKVDEIKKVKRETWLPRVLVLGPGGARGFLELGALYELSKSSLLDIVDTFCGVSIGAVICLLLVCGYSVETIVYESLFTDFFRDINEISIRGTIEMGGLMSNNMLRSKLTELVKQKFGYIPTLYDIYEKTGYSLITVALNTTHKKTEYFTPFTHGHCSSVDVVLCSCNIPFIYYKLTYQNCVYVDGALGNPYPIDFFDDGRTDVLGLYIVNEYNKTKEHGEEQREDGIFYYFKKVIDSLMEQRRISVINHSTIRTRHLALPTSITDTTGITTTMDEKGKMYGEGLKLGKAFVLAYLKDELIDNKESCCYSYPEYHLIQQFESTINNSLTSIINNALNET